MDEFRIGIAIIFFFIAIYGVYELINLYINKDNNWSSTDNFYFKHNIKPPEKKK